METVAYDSLKNLQEKHWWFEGRREIVSSLIKKFACQKNDLRILEAGCGYGGNLSMLGRWGTVDGFEYDAGAREFAGSLLGRPVAYGHLPSAPGFGGRQFDVIAMLDVLEHIEDDIGSLAALRSMIAEDGFILITVPAFPWLWSQHDEIHHHKRRYTKATLDSALISAGFTPVKTSYFNTLLFPLAMAQRIAQRILKRKSSISGLPPPAVNRTFAGVFGFERHLVGKFSMPFGLSLVTIARPVDG